MVMSPIDLLASGVGVLALGMCGFYQVEAALWGLAAQALCLAAITAELGVEHRAGHLIVLAAVVLVVKAIGIPAYLSWAARRMDIRRDRGVMLSAISALLLGFAALVSGLYLAPRLAVPSLGHTGAAGVALSTVLIGMLLMMTRRLAISQVVGFLVLENGIFLYSLTQTSGMPLLVEMGVIFDVLVAVLIAGLVIFRMNRSFEHIDVAQLRGLRH